MRSIRPEFFTDEDLPTVSPHARLLFIGLWTVADREGRIEDRPGRIRAQVFPHESHLDVETLLAELQGIGVIARYKVASTSVISVLSFTRFQKPHHNEQTSVLPAMPCNGGASNDQGSCKEALRTEKGVIEKGIRSSAESGAAPNPRVADIVKIHGEVIGSLPLLQRDRDTIRRWADAGFTDDAVRAALGRGTGKDSPIAYADSILRSGGVFGVAETARKTEKTRVVRKDGTVEVVEMPV